MEPLVASLRPYSTVRTVKKSASILFQGEVPRSIMIVREGFIRAYTITSSGEERVVAIYGRGAIFPLSWILGETRNTLFYYNAVSDARLLTVPKNDFEKIIYRDTASISIMLKHIGREYTSLLLRITGLEQSRSVEKIAYTLYYLLFRYGSERKPGLYTVDVKLSQATIASLVGLTRESTTKNLMELKRKGIISYSHSTYTLNKRKLEQFIGEDAFRDVGRLVA